MNRVTKREEQAENAAIHADHDHGNWVPYDQIDGMYNRSCYLCSSVLFGAAISASYRGSNRVEVLVLDNHVKAIRLNLHVDRVQSDSVDIEPETNSSPWEDEEDDPEGFHGDESDDFPLGKW